MKTVLCPFAAQATQGGEKVETHGLLYIAIAITVGVLISLALGLLHKSDRPDPVAHTYSVQSAVMRAGVSLFGSTILTLGMLMSTHQAPALLLLLLSTATGVVYGLLAYFDSNTIQTSIWKAARTTASAAALGQTFLEIYGGK